MAETNFYSYMFAQASESVAFDELEEVVDLSSPENIQMAFLSYVSDYSPPIDIKEELVEETFKKVDNEDEPPSIRYEISIPGIEGEIDSDEFRAYLEVFLDRIGAENNSESGYKVDVSISNDERGGQDIEIYMELTGKQIRTGSNKEE